MNTADAALNAIDATTRASLAFTHPKTNVTAAAAISNRDVSSIPVSDMGVTLRPSCGDTAS